MSDRRTSRKVDPPEFFRQVVQQFEAAKDSTQEVHEHVYRVAGRTIRLTFAGSALLPLIAPAISHLRVNTKYREAVDLNICLWDAASTGVGLPPRPWGENDHLSRGDIRGFDHPVIRTAYTLGPNTLSMLDTSANTAVLCSTSAAHIPTDYRGSPLLVILSWWAGQHSLQYVHAGAVGRDAGGVLLVGKGGSGKSTSALACVGSVLGYAADDYCLLDAGSDVPFVYSIYNSAKLEADHLRNFPELVPLVSNAHDLHRAKAVIYLNEHMPERLVSGFPVKAVLIPRVTGRADTNLSSATRAQALAALAPSTLFQLSGSGKDNFRRMGAFVRRVPSYYLDAGTDLRQIPASIAELLDAS